MINQYETYIGEACQCYTFIVERGFEIVPQFKNVLLFR